MGLNATIYCNCYKIGKTKCQPPHPELVETDSDGGIYIVTPDDDKYFEFENWKTNACEHSDMVFVHYRLGNISSIGHAKNFIERLTIEKGHTFPILLNKVIFSGSHAGDH